MTISIAINANKVEGPFGGANRFAANLKLGLEKAGYYVTRNLVPNLDIIIIVIPHDGLPLAAFSPADAKAYKESYPDTIVIHRVNGSDEHRGYDNGSNRRILSTNQCADHTIYVSQFMKDFWGKKGIDNSKGCTVVKTGSDRLVFNPNGHKAYQSDRPLKLITHHWSSNYMKGFDIYERIDEMLELPKWKDRIDFTFVGHMPLGYSLKNARCLGPADGVQLADLLREHDGYVTASRFEAGGNHYIEAMQCGLPVLHLDHGSSPEYCEDYGITFQLSNFEEKLEEFILNIEVLEKKTLQCTYSDTLMSKEYLDVIERLVGQRSLMKRHTKKYKFLFYKWSKIIKLFRKRIGHRIAR